MKLFTYLRYWPLFLLLRYKQRVKKDKEALKFDEDADRLGLSFFQLLKWRPYYKVLLYRRLGGGKILRKIFGEYPLFISGCKMPLGGGVYMDHPHGTHLNAKSIGKNFSCRHLTTIGNKRDGDNENRPVIGDNVTLGVNVTIIGPVTIGNNVIVGAGSVVVKDVPANCVVAGNPAKIIKTIP